MQDTINVVNHGPKDRLLTAKLSADILSTIEVITELVQRDAAADCIDEHLALLADTPREEKETRAVLLGVVKKMVLLIEAFEKFKVFVHCERCHSSFQGAGMTGEMARTDADASWLRHIEAVHPECKECHHQMSDHELGVCDVFDCRCRLKAVKS